MREDVEMTNPDLERIAVESAARKDATDLKPARSKAELHAIKQRNAQICISLGGFLLTLFLVLRDVGVI